ncbi:MAG: hypothetical protein WD737_05560 [Gemmatimonadota bacterium]
MGLLDDSGLLEDDGLLLEDDGLLLEDDGLLLEDDGLRLDRRRGATRWGTRHRWELRRVEA